ncbi:MAG TPA: hypothetical protein VMN60_01390 [Longimicrobiales bacterium]|nr:hypothetical protein [Longimicrobiales bacterium]
MNVQIGLCAVCRNARVIDSRRGSRFWLCSLSRVDARFPKYPPLPVVRCAGHVPGEPLRAGADPASGGSHE